MACAPIHVPLLLGNDHTGASELADIAWDPTDAAPGQVAAHLHMLLAAALLHLAAARAPFATRLVPAPLRAAAARAESLTAPPG